MQLTEEAIEAEIRREYPGLAFSVWMFPQRFTQVQVGSKSAVREDWREALAICLADDGPVRKIRAFARAPTPVVERPSLPSPAPDLDTLTDQALADRPDLFSPSDDISARKLAEAERDEALESLAVESEKVASLQRQLAERDAEPPPLSPDPVKHMIPDEIRKLMEDGESLSNAKRRLTELLWVEQAELRNLRGTDRGDLKREAEIERLLGLFARLGEI